MFNFIFWLIFSIKEIDEDSGHQYNAFMCFVSALGVSIPLQLFFVFKELTIWKWALIGSFVCYLLIGIIALYFTKKLWGSGFISRYSKDC
ncbi:MAG: hypothetical protein V1851_00155 [Patescibacteria group bacterium]